MQMHPPGYNPARAHGQLFHFSATSTFNQSIPHSLFTILQFRLSLFSLLIPLKYLLAITITYMDNHACIHHKFIIEQTTLLRQLKYILYFIYISISSKS